MSATSTAVVTEANLTLSAIEQELVGGEVQAVANMQRDAAAKQRFTELAEYVEAGSVPAERLSQLSTILEIGLQSGRIRRLHGPDGEQAIGRVYQRTPSGIAAAQAAAKVSAALRALIGQTIDDIRVSALGPGSYSLLIDTTECQITVRLDRTGVDVDSVGIGI